MGILSINRNLVSKFKPRSLSTPSFSIFSSDLCPAAIPPAGTQEARAPNVVGDLKRSLLFLTEHFYKGITNYSLISAAAAENNNLWKEPPHRICSPFPGQYRLVGSCKEWTLFFSYAEGVEDETTLVCQYLGRLSLWNPTTGRIKTLPPSLLPRPQSVYAICICCFGFGFDPKSQDYKLICFLQHDRSLASFMSNPSVDAHIELYSLKTNSWKQITPTPHVGTPYSYSHSVHIDGVQYWAGDSILAFDFADETFSRFSLPDAPHLWRMRDHYCLAEFHGSLAVIVPYWVLAEELTEEAKEKLLQQPFSIEIWVWNGETWNVGPKVAVGDFPVGDRIARVLAFFQNEYLFLQGFKESELMLFNCKTGKLENLGIHHEPPESGFTVRMPRIFPYTVPI